MSLSSWNLIHHLFDFVYGPLLSQTPQCPGHQDWNQSNLLLPPFSSSSSSPSFSLYPPLNPGGWRHSARRCCLYAFTQDVLFRTNCVHYTRRAREEQPPFLSCEIKTLCMFAGPYTRGTHVCVWVRGGKPLIHDSWKTRESEVGRHCFLNFPFAVPCVLIHARSWPFAWHPVEVAGRGHLCSGWAARRRRRRSTLLAIISGRNPTEGAALTARWSPHQDSRSSGHQDRGLSSVGEELSWGLVCVFFSNWKAAFDTDVSKTIHSHLCHPARPPWHSRGRECQPTDSSSTKHFHRKDPVNFLFPWPRGGGGGRQRVSLCQMLWKRGVYKSAPTCIGDSQLRTSKSALAVSLQAGRHLTVFVQNWCCFSTPND